jgi:uncharacterized protein (TIGR00269 family)
MGDSPNPTCSLCANQAVYLNRETGNHLCSRHLKESVENRVLARIRNGGELPPTIGVAFSGGKDSTALLAALVALKDVIPSRLIALTVDEGISGYREDTIRHAEWVCQKLGVEHQIISFSKLYEKSLDQLMENPEHKACTICGILRRRALEILAERLQIHLIVTGHNQDDHAQTALMNALSADIKKVFAGSGAENRFAKRVKPFAEVSEREVSLYAILAGLFKDLPECPYAGDALRSEVRRLLYKFEQEFPGSMHNAAMAEETIRQSLKEKVSHPGMITCKVCGWPGSDDVCQVCNVLKKNSNVKK